MDRSRLKEALLDALTRDPGPAPDHGFDPLPGRYLFLRQLGRGGFGEVWLARDINLGRLVAVKSLHPSISGEGRAVLAREARRLAGLRPHAHIVSVHAWEETTDQAFLVLQYVEGGSLEDRVKRSGPLTWPEAARFLADVAEGLGELHAQGIAHCDIKPANLLWDMARDDALLTDFGIANSIETPESIGGTPGFMAPEVLEGSVTPACDVFSLCATLYALLAGKPPWRASTIPALLVKMLRGVELDEAIRQRAPAPLQELILRGLASEPSQRPELSEVQDILRRTLNQSLVDTLLTTPEAAAQGSGLELRIRYQTAQGTWEPVPCSAPRRDIALRRRRPESAAVREGDLLRLEVTPPEDGYVTLINVGTSGAVTVLFPNPFVPDNRVVGGRQLNVPADQDSFDLVLEPPSGTERMVALFTRDRLDLLPRDVLAAIERNELALVEPPRATRDIAILRRKVRPLPPDAWASAVVELRH